MNLLNLCLVFIIVIGSVILHELAHGIVAYFLGDRTAKDAGRLTFNPLKHIDPIMSILIPVVLYVIGAPVFGGAKPVPVNYRNLKGKEWGMALVAIAGPLTNFLIALLAFLVGHALGLIGANSSGVFYSLSDSIPSFIFAETVIINLGFMIFNLIPIPPLDGSRVLYAIAPDPIRGFLGVLERYGFVIVYALILLFGHFFSFLMSSGIEAVLVFFNLLAH